MNYVPSEGEIRLLSEVESKDQVQEKILCGSETARKEQTERGETIQMIVSEAARLCS